MRLRYMLFTLLFVNYVHASESPQPHPLNQHSGLTLSGVALTGDHTYDFQLKKESCFKRSCVATCALFIIMLKKLGCITSQTEEPTIENTSNDAGQ